MELTYSLKYLFFTSLILIGLLSYSQQNDFSVLNHSNINSVIQNPANLVSTSDIEFSITPLANIQVDVVLPFSISTFFVRQSNNKYTLDFTNLSQHSRSNNSFYGALNMTYFYFSLKGGESYWNFYVKEQFLTTMEFDKPFLDFLNLGNKAFVGETVDLSFPLLITQYRTYNLSWAKQINDRLDIGFTGKLYFGKSIINIQPEFSLFTQNDIDYLDFAVSGGGDISLPVDYTEIENGTIETDASFNLKQYLLGSENPGLGIDLGLNYKFNQQFSLSVNLCDVGFINWNNENTNINIEGSYKWDGIDVSGIVNSEEDNSFDEDLTNTVSQDSLLSGLFNLKESDYLWYTPTGFGFGLVYKKSEKLKFAIHNYVQYYDPFIREYFAATGSLTMGEKWTVMSGLSFTNGSYFNMPLGIVFTSKRIRSTFNLSNLWGTFLPASSNRFGGSFNMSFLINYKKKVNVESDIDYPFYIKDESMNIEF